MCKKYCPSLEIIMDAAFNTVCAKTKIHILLSSKIHIVLQIKFI